MVVDDRRDPHVFVRPLQQQEGALQSRVHLHTDTHERVARAGLVPVLLRSMIKLLIQSLERRSGECGTQTGMDAIQICASVRVITEDQRIQE